VRSCGCTLIFSGPLQPGSVALESRGEAAPGKDVPAAVLLRQRIELFNELSLDLAAHSRHVGSPVRFSKLGGRDALERVARSRMRFFTESVSVSSVPRRRAGIRVMLTTHHTEEELVRLVQALAAGSANQPHSLTLMCAPMRPRSAGLSPPYEVYWDPRVSTRRVL